MTTQAITVDEFASDEYGPSHTPLPFIQFLNTKDPSKAGFFITVENAKAVNFNPSDEWQEFEARFQSGPEYGFRSLTARLVVVRRSTLLMFNRESREFLGAFDRDLYNAEKVVLKTKYLVYLASRQKELLHDSPLQLTAKGSLCGSFGEHYSQFRNQLNRAYGKQRGDRFFALSIFAVKLQPTLKGQQKKSWVCSISDHGIPTKENWQAFFLGYDPDIKQKLLADFEAHQDFGQIHRDQSADPYDLLSEEDSDF